MKHAVRAVPICPSCSLPAELVSGVDIFPFLAKTYGRRYWICRPCDTRVGCHPNTDIPLGTMADKETRHASGNGP